MGFQFNKLISAFWVGHLPFLQVGFVTVRVLAAWLRLDKVTFYRCKLFLSLVAVTSFSLPVLVFFVTVGLHKIRKPSLLLAAVDAYFFRLLFSFQNAYHGAFSISWPFGVDNVAFSIF